MPYQSEITRSNPSAIIFLIDQSESMEDGIKGDTNNPKKDGVAKAINRFIASLVTRCTRGPGNVYPYYYVGAIGYGLSVGPGFVGKFQGMELVCISDLADAARIDLKTIHHPEGDEVVRTRVWIDPVANGLTPMREAFQTARRIAQDFITRYPGCYPPMVINITDGDSTDGDPQEEAEQLAQLKSEDGNLLVFNIHLSSANAPSTVFPNSDSSLAEDLSRMLFGMSSVLPNKMRQVAKELKLAIPEGARGFAFNADLVCVTNLLEIGTRSATMLR